MIVFTSDNGFLIGDHGLIDKRNAYEGSIRIPMVVYAPGLVPAGVTNPGRISTLDFAPTFLDLAHVARPPQFEGQSALPLLTGEVTAADWKPAGLRLRVLLGVELPDDPDHLRDRARSDEVHPVPRRLRHSRSSTTWPGIPTRCTT